MLYTIFVLFVGMFLGVIAAHIFRALKETDRHGK